MDGQYWPGDQTMSTNEWLLTSDFWQFLEPWLGRWYEYEIFIASCTDNIYDLENERDDCWGTWLIMLGFMDLGWPRVCRRSTSVLWELRYHHSNWGVAIIEYPSPSPTLPTVVGWLIVLFKITITNLWLPLRYLLGANLWYQPVWETITDCH